MGDTTIEWTDHSVNPIRARLRDAAHAGLTKGGYGSGVGHYCELISAGCARCYASKSQARFGMPAFPGVQKVAPAAADVGTATVAVNDKVEVFFDDSRLQEVLNRKKPTKYFWCDQTDLFGRWVPDDWIDRCFAVMAATPWHTHQVLTKRADRMAAWFNDPGWPLPNVWLGVSVENQPTADERIPHLLRCPAAVRFLSVEPLLGAIEMKRWLPTGRKARRPDGTPFVAPNYYMLCCAACGWIGSSELCHGDEESVYCAACSSEDVEEADRISWCIVGGESGHGARPCNFELIRSIVLQCRAAGVPCFVKQLGARPLQKCDCNRGEFIHQGCPQCDGEGLVELEFRDPKGGDPSEWPEDLRVREFPTVKALQ